MLVSVVVLVLVVLVVVVAAVVVVVKEMTRDNSGQNESFLEHTVIFCVLGDITCHHLVTCT